MARRPDRGVKPAAAEAAAPPGASQAVPGAPQAESVQPAPEPEPEPVPTGPELRLATTAATHIAHDLHLYAPGEQLALTRPQFEALARSRSVVEAEWDDCAAPPDPAA